MPADALPVRRTVPRPMTVPGDGTLPSSVQYGTVTWTAVSAVADGVDVDGNPDAVPVTGTLTFTPSATVLLATAAKVTVIATPVTYTLDATGVLRDSQGDAGVTLVATDSPGITPTGWTWTVAYKLNNGLSRGSFSFSLPSGTTVDLTTVAPVSSSNGAAIIQGPEGPAGPAGPAGSDAMVTDAAVAGQVPQPLTSAALKAAFVPRWKAGTAYAAGDKVLSPDGQVVQAIAAFTSGSSYLSTNWTSVTASYAAGEGALPAFTDFRFMRGINAAGGEFAANSGATLPGVEGVDYAYNTLPLYQYLRRRGHRIVRLPFSWERVQPTLSGALDATGIADLRAAVQAAGDAGLLVLLDMHNYGSYYRQDDVKVSLNNGITQADFQDAWTRIVGELGDLRCIAGWGLMNEPNSLPPMAFTYTKTADIYTFDASTQSWQGSGVTLTVGSFPGMTGAGALDASKVLAANSGNFSSIFRINSPGSDAFYSVPLPAGTSIEWEVYVPATTPGTVRVRPELTNSSSVSQVGDYTTLTKGAVTKVYYQVPDALTGVATNHKNLSMQVEVDGSDGTTPTEILIGNISYGPGTGGGPAWATFSQAGVDAIRATGDTRAIFVAGDDFSSASRWTVANGSTPWITDPADNIVYEAHYYFAVNNSGVYPANYSDLEADAVARGWTDLAARVTEELHTFTDWVTSTGVTGFIGEIGWPFDESPDSYNAIGEVLYGILDAAGIGATQWATGTSWSSGYRLQTYAYDSTKTVFTPNAQAATIEAHQSKSIHGRLDADNTWTGANDFKTAPTVNGGPITAVLPPTRPHLADLHGVVGLSLDPAISNSTSSGTAGTARTAKVAALPGSTCTQVGFAVTTAAVGTTDSVAVYDSAGNRLATGGGSGLLFGSATVTYVTVSSFTVPTDGVLIVAVLSTGGTTQPAFRSSTSTAGSSNNLGLESNGMKRSGTVASLASLPATLPSQTAASPVILCAVK